MRTHRLAKYFPILEGEEFDLLVEDIKKNGQLEPIVTFDDEILDGVNRYRACQKLGIEPKYEKYKGDDPLAYVVSLNIRRRHMDISQRAMLATEMLPEFEREAESRRVRKSPGLSVSVDTDKDKWGEHRASSDAAKMFGVSAPTVRRAKRVKEQAPDKVDDIIKGKVTVREVDTALRQKKERERHAEAAKSRQKSMAEMTLDWIHYITTLEQIVSMLPVRPPKDATEEALSEARGYAHVIFRRLEAFNE